MNWEDIHNLNDHGVIIGAHSHNHVLLNDYQSCSYINNQITKSLEMIKKKSGSVVTCVTLMVVSKTYPRLHMVL